MLCITVGDPLGVDVKVSNLPASWLAMLQGPILALMGRSLKVLAGCVSSHHAMGTTTFPTTLLCHGQPQHCEVSTHGAEDTARPCGCREVHC